MYTKFIAAPLPPAAPAASLSPTAWRGEAVAQARWRRRRWRAGRGVQSFADTIFDVTLLDVAK
eukprot:3663475-Prymnesium_polylepis.1